MNRRKLDENKLKEIQRQQGNRGGPGGRFGGVKEKPKDLKGTIKKLLKYVSFSKITLIVLVVIVLVSTFISLSTNIVIEKLIASLGSYNFEVKEWDVAPNKTNLIINILLLGEIYLAYCIYNTFRHY